MNIHVEYIVDENLNKKSVVIPYSEWQEIIEELDDIRAYDISKQEDDGDLIDFDRAVVEIKAGNSEIKM